MAEQVPLWPGLVSGAWGYAGGVVCLGVGVDCRGHQMPKCSLRFPLQPQSPACLSLIERKMKRKAELY